jgi:hypothetical protein
MAEHVEHPITHSYLLRIWQEHDESASVAVYRFSLIDPYTHERYSFTSLEHMVIFLEDWLHSRTLPPDDVQPS